MRYRCLRLHVPEPLMLDIRELHTKLLRRSLGNVPDSEHEFVLLLIRSGFGAVDKEEHETALIQVPRLVTPSG